MSFYNEEKQDVDYYVQRLLSIPLADAGDPGRGSIWNVYINGALEDWMQVMRLNRIVCKEDTIIWRYHQKVESEADARAVCDRPSTVRLKLLSNTNNDHVTEDNAA